MAHIGTFVVNTKLKFMKFEDIVGLSMVDNVTYICQVQGGKIIACMSDITPDGGFLVERDEGFACTPINGKKLWIKNMASTDVYITVAD